MIGKLKTFYKEGYGVELKNPSPFLKMYETNKDNIIKMLGGAKRLEFDVDITIEDEYYEGLIDQFLKTYPELKKAVKSLSKSEFLDNSLKTNKKINNQKFNKGMRSSKFLAKILGRDIEQMHIDYSMIIQASKVKGQLVLSVDLIDILTASMNNKGWSSCLDLDGGVYRGGIYSYALDSSTFIAYLKSSKTMINGIEVDDKRWRQFIHYNHKTKQVIFSKNYPYYSRQLSILTREILEELISSYFDIENKWMVLRKIKAIKAGVIDVGETFDYNDVLLSNNKDDNITAIYHKKGAMELEVPIGIREPVCITCGEKILPSEEMIVCDNCDTMIRCVECGDFS